MALFIISVPLMIAVVAMALGFIVVLGLGLTVPPVLVTLIDSAVAQVGGAR